MLFFCGISEIEHRFIDISHQAIETPLFPVSVGVRSQAMKLRFATAETQGRFLPPRQSFDRILDTFQQRFGKSVAKPIFHQVNLGDTLSLIYSPFYLTDRLHDAILDKPVSRKLPPDFDIDTFGVDRRQWKIRFISALCPNCGWDLEGKRDTLALACKNCNSIWYSAGNKLKQLKFGHFQGKTGQTTYLPFWRIKADITGVTLDSYADLVAVANLPRAVQKGWQDIPFRFWIPAFKIRPKKFLQLAGQATRCQPRERLIPEIPDAPIYPVNMPVEEAIESLKIILADFGRPRKTIRERLGDIRIDAKKFSLTLIPFNEGSHEFLQPDLQLTINKNALALSKNL